MVFPQISQIIIYLEVLSLIVFIFPSYLYFGKSDDPLFAFRMKLIAIGVLLFSGVSIVDGVLKNPEPSLVTTKFFLIIALSLIYVGYQPPMKLRQKFN